MPYQPSKMELVAYNEDGQTKLKPIINYIWSYAWCFPSMPMCYLTWLLETCLPLSRDYDNWQRETNPSHCQTSIITFLTQGNTHVRRIPCIYSLLFWCIQYFRCLTHGHCALMSTTSLLPRVTDNSKSQATVHAWWNKLRYWFFKPKNYFLIWQLISCCIGLYNVHCQWYWVCWNRSLCVWIYHLSNRGSTRVLVGSMCTSSSSVWWLRKEASSRISTMDAIFIFLDSIDCPAMNW